MALAITHGSQMSEMNVTPLVDVMLVLLIIFMVTVPMLNYANTVSIAPSPPTKVVLPDPLRVHVGAGDTLSLDGQPVTMEQLQARFAAASALGTVGGKFDAARQPAVELSVEPDAEYGLVARVMSRAKNAGLERISFTR